LDETASWGESAPTTDGVPLKIEDFDDPPNNPHVILHAVNRLLESPRFGPATAAPNKCSN